MGKRYTKAETERIYGPWAYRAWGYGIGCVVQGCTNTSVRPGSTHPIECCHTRGVDPDPADLAGTGRKGAWAGQTFFACWTHHDESALGRHRFAERHTLVVLGRRCYSLADAAAETLRRFQQHEEDFAW